MLRHFLVCGVFAIAGAAGVTTIGCGGDDSTASAGDASTDAPADRATIDGPATVDASGDDSASADAGSDARPISCDDLCDSLVANCDSADIEYTSRPACLKACMPLALGVYGDMLDSVGCRQQQAEVARFMPTPACQIAGPFGGGKCGDRCADYCRVVVASCTGANEVYATTAACMADCGSAYKFDSDAGFEYTDGGNTLNCREGALLPLLSDLTGNSASTVCPLLKATSTGCH